MSISSTTRKAGPYIGNGSTTQFPFSFKVFSASDVLVIHTDPTGVESTLLLGTDYTISLNADQDTNPGGAITTATAPAVGYLITATSQVQNLQPVTLTNSGGFYPKVINDALDRTTIQVQQLAEQVSRAVKVSISSQTTPEALAEQLIEDAKLAKISADQAANSATAAAESANAAATSASDALAARNSAALSASNALISKAAAATSANIAGFQASKAEISANQADGSATAALASADAAAISANNAANSANMLSTQASEAEISANQAANSAAAAAASANAAATSASEAGMRAGDANTSAINAVVAKNAAAISASAALNSQNAAANSANAANTQALSAMGSANQAASSAAAAAASYDSFDDRYLGEKAVEPVVDNDGNSLLLGALYWNSTLGQMKAWTGTIWQALSPGLYGLFYKTDPTTVAFFKTSHNTASVKAGTRFSVLGTTIVFDNATPITMPNTLIPGTDYTIWVRDNGAILATTDFWAAPNNSNWRKIGGFHYAPGGHSGLPGGGNNTPQINEYSFWDLKFRPSCLDPRGMALVADSFWADIYMLGIDHLSSGTSRYNVRMADGAEPPTIPTKFGGDGIRKYSSFNWWEANEVMRSHGKHLPSYGEFATLAYGTTEAQNLGYDPGSTTWSPAYVSKWGINQASGGICIWGSDFGGGTTVDADNWSDTGGRGSAYMLEKVAVYGVYGGSASLNGSRASMWLFSPIESSFSIGARGIGKHLVVD